MRRAALTAPPLAILLGSSLACVLALGCDQAQSNEPRSASTSGSDSRLARARHEMGLEEMMREGDDETPEGDDDEPIDLAFALGTEHLPELPTDIEADVPPLRDGLARAIDAFALSRPVPGETLDRVGLQLWVEADYARWLRQRAEALRLARVELSGAEQGEIGEYVVASAVIGLLFARFADAIATMPLPRGVESVDGDRLRFRDAFLRAAAPLFDRAADAFGACASATVRSGDGSLIPWQRFCDQRLAEVQDAPRPID